MGIPKSKGGSLNWKSESIQRDTYNWNSEGMGVGEGGSWGLEFPQGTDKSVCIP